MGKLCNEKRGQHFNSSFDCHANQNSLHWGLNPGPSVYRIDALPLSYKGLRLNSSRWISRFQLFNRQWVLQACAVFLFCIWKLECQSNWLERKITRINSVRKLVEEPARKLSHAIHRTICPYIDIWFICLEPTNGGLAIPVCFVWFAGLVSGMSLAGWQFQVMGGS